MGCALFALQKIIFRSNQGAMDREEYVSQGERGPVQETSRGSVHLRSSV